MHSESVSILNRRLPKPQKLVKKASLYKIFPSKDFKSKIQQTNLDKESLKRQKVQQFLKNSWNIRCSLWNSWYCFLGHRSKNSPFFMKKAKLQCKGKQLDQLVGLWTLTKAEQCLKSQTKNSKVFTLLIFLLSQCFHKSTIIKNFHSEQCYIITKGAICKCKFLQFLQNLQKLSITSLNNRDGWIGHKTN